MGITVESDRSLLDTKTGLASATGPKPAVKRNLQAIAINARRELALKDRNSKDHKKALASLVKHHKATMAEMNGADDKGFNYLLVYIDKSDKYHTKKDNKKKADAKKTDRNSKDHKKAL